MGRHSLIPILSFEAKYRDIQKLVALRLGRVGEGYNRNVKTKALYILGLVFLVPLLAFAYYALSPLLINIQANDAAPALSQEVMTPAQVIGTAGHPASGTARIIVAEGKGYVRYENFKTLNGPDLYVYLAKDTDAAEFISLGRVRATEGNVNYEIPEGVDVAQYRYVLTWCKAFGVLFNHADLSGI